MPKALLITYPQRSIREEAIGLVESAGYELAGLITQRYLRHSKYGLGTGKLEELKELAKEADVIVFDERLKSSQIYNLAKLTGLEVIDREKLILEIFNKRAKSKVAKLQVKLAELKYEIPRAKEKVRLAKKGEQPGFYGLGRYEVDDYYRAVRLQMREISRKLKEVRKRIALYRLRREELNLPVISLAGYTSVGKTTLFNLLTKESRETGKGLFTTLGTTTRVFKVKGFKALLSDTVGFISRLPTYMIDAFRSTLEELRYADLILLLLDASDPPREMARKFRICSRILAELEVDPYRVVPVLNKCDLVGAEGLDARARALGLDRGECIAISAKEGIGIERLEDRIYELVINPVRRSFRLGVDELKRISKALDMAEEYVKTKVSIEGEEAMLSVIGPSWAVERLGKLVGKA